MADAKVSDLVALAGADRATGDLLYIIDVSATTSGSKKITIEEFFKLPVGIHLVCGEGVNIIAGTTTGTKIGTSATQKLGFFNATPIIQPTVATDATVATLITALTNLGLIKNS